ncbi:ThuA domain-containing protein [Rathayibacter sp. SD072]|uniref:ThuA domain-containing protein n=1 Tax=Rathayibacter sp. SD072 TaxID=2781731 RepID=UPI001A97C84E|nr:ThuA domain-containing protein [Rathayibacter sp. SD072]MBO0985789.1 ThuA domain-containing protein [Rathayibacter sp. SD072]
MSALETTTATTPTGPVEVLVWNEFRHETRGDETVMKHYPEGIHRVIADGLAESLGDQVAVRTATLPEPEHGLSEEALARTDVLLWWGHIAHGEVSDEVVQRVLRHVQEGMGILVLHSGHYSKIFQVLMGTTCSLKWRNDQDRELVWTIAPTHPIAQGVPSPIVIPQQEMYGEYFDIPVPEETVFLSTFTGGEVFRSGVTYTRGLGKVFYFSPGDQDYPVYHHPDIKRVLANAVRWARPTRVRTPLTADHHPRGWFES